MNQLSRFCVCRSRSVLRKNPFASKPISSSSLISNNPTSSHLIIFISKFHHTFSYPPQISSAPVNQFRKFSGDPAAVGGEAATAVGGDPAAAVGGDLEVEFNSDDGDSEDDISEEDDLQNEINELHEDIGEARDDIELKTIPPLDAVKIPADKLKAILKKFGLRNVKYRDYPPHLQRFVEEIKYARVCVSEIVAFGKYAAAGKYSGGRPNWSYFTKWYDAGGMEELESFETKKKLKKKCDTSPTAGDQIPVPVDGASSVAGRH